MIRLAFIGTGFMGQNAHLCNYANIEGCKVVAIAEPRKELAALVAQKYFIENVYENHIELMKNIKVDGFVASQPYRHHAALVPELFDAGIPVFTEKPISFSIKAAQNIVRLADQKNIKHMVGYHKRSDPAMEFAKELIEKWQKSGQFGKMNYVRITMPPGDWIGGVEPALSSDENPGSLRLETDMDIYDAGGNQIYDTFINYYIHQLNAMRFLFGEDYTVTYAEKSQTILNVESKSGVAGIIEMAPWSNTIDWDESCLIAFEKGYIKITLPPPLAKQQAGKVTVMEDDGVAIPRIWQPSLPSVHAMKRQAENFISVIKGEKNPPCNGKEALKDLLSAKEYIDLLLEKI